MAWRKLPILYSDMGHNDEIVKAPSKSYFRIRSPPHCQRMAVRGCGVRAFAVAEPTDQSYGSEAVFHCANVTGGVFELTTSGSPTNLERAPLDRTSNRENEERATLQGHQVSVDMEASLMVRVEGKSRHIALPCTISPAFRRGPRFLPAKTVRDLSTNQGRTREPTTTTNLGVRHLGRRRWRWDRKFIPPLCSGTVVLRCRPRFSACFPTSACQDGYTLPIRIATKTEFF